MGGLLTASVWAIVLATRPPEMATAQTAASDGIQAQQKIFEIMKRARGGRAHTVELSEREVNAFLARHLGDAVDVPLKRLAVRLQADGRAELAGALPWKEVLTVPPLSPVPRLLPDGWLTESAWLTMLARVHVDRTDSRRGRRYLRLDVEAFWLGRLRLPEIMVRILIDPALLRLLKTPLPAGVDAIRVESGRVLVDTSP